MSVPRMRLRAERLPRSLTTCIRLLTISIPFVYVTCACDCLCLLIKLSKTTHPSTYSSTRPGDENPHLTPIVSNLSPTVLNLAAQRVDFCVWIKEDNLKTRVGEEVHQIFSGSRHLVSSCRHLWYRKQIFGCVSKRVCVPAIALWNCHRTVSTTTFFCGLL